MKTLDRVLLLIIGGGVLLWVGVPTAFYHYDERTKERLVRMAARELPPHAPMGRMNAFMGSHTTGYALDKDNSELAGFLPQSRFDKALFDRKVGIYLRVDGKSQTFRNAHVEIYYTFL